MKHQVKRRRYTKEHPNVFMLGVTREKSNGWNWRCDGDTDPYNYWQRWTQRKRRATTSFTRLFLPRKRVSLLVGAPAMGISKPGHTAIAGKRI
jgi:hypothetical protein